MFQNCKNSRFAPFKDTLRGNVIARELMGHVAIPFKWKNFCFIEDALMMSFQSSRQDVSQGEER